jgi:hypothetical protein
MLDTPRRYTILIIYGGQLVSVPRDPSNEFARDMRAPVIISHASANTFELAAVQHTKGNVGYLHHIQACSSFSCVTAHAPTNLGIDPSGAFADLPC